MDGNSRVRRLLEDTWTPEIETETPIDSRSDLDDPFESDPALEEADRVLDGMVGDTR